MEGCSCERSDLLRHLRNVHSMQSTELDSADSFRMTLSFSSVGTTGTSGIVIELDDDNQHLLWLMRRVVDVEKDTTEFGLSVHALSDYTGPLLAIKVGCTADERSCEQMVWRARVHNLTDAGEVHAEEQTMRLSYPADSRIFGRGEAEGKLTLIIDTTFMKIGKRSQ